jgi:hypothetical protein
MGLEKGRDHFLFVMRAAIFENSEYMILSGVVQFYSQKRNDLIWAIRMDLG